MPIKGVDFVRMTDEEREELFSVPDPNCDICNKPIKPYENIEYIRDSKDKLQLAHEDCYFSDFSEEIDRHPIGHPCMHRGQGNFSLYKTFSSQQSF
ncbi:MAG: hypothetical protein PHH54_06945 [Candidatus Nanoarchaeia archaeon]|nr:hypothetical protein [Candidatus Nanoarchaeia archaeon]MDD5741692.1 hypothetical protein [Candidatus Nanoarchaeia archaeon]